MFFLSSSVDAVDSQYKTRLNTGWEFLIGDLGSPLEAFRQGKNAQVPIWKEVTLPHSYNAKDAVDPDVNYYQGPGWYRTRLKINNPIKDGRTLLHFEGAGQKTEVYIYTKKVGYHEGGYDEFEIDITDAIHEYLAKYEPEDGLIPIAIRTDNSRDVDLIPSDLSDFNIYGGIYRYLNLVYLPPNYLQQVHLKTDLQPDLKSADLQITSGIMSHVSGNGKIVVDGVIYTPEGDVLQKFQFTVPTSEKRVQLFSGTIRSPELWSTDQPSLYTCKLIARSSQGVQEISHKFGFRHFEFETKGPFYLNNERLLLRGTHRHEDHAGVGPAMTGEMIRKEMRMIKEMGVNFIRLGHYQQSRIVLEECDRLGILVWEEIPWCRGGIGGEEYRQRAKKMLTNMINQHYNHPSIIIWGLGNENDWPGDFETFPEDSIRDFMKELNALSHQLDPGRKTAIRRCDFCKDVVDVYSPSIWAGWYRGKYTDYWEATRTNWEQVDHFLHVEWGASNHARRHSPNPDLGLENISGSGNADERAGDFLMKGGEPRVSRDGDWTESYAVNLVDWHLKEQEKMDWLTGTAYWPFKDFSTPLRPENPVPYVNQKGVVERDLTKKESYYVFQSYWTTQPMVHIYGHTFTTRWDEEGDGNLVKVYSNCPEVELFLNGKSMGKKIRDSQDFPAAGLRWRVKLEEGTNELKAVAFTDDDPVEDNVTINFQAEQWRNPSQLLLEVIKIQNDTATLRALALDSTGVLCLDADNFVNFDLSGDGELIDNLGTSTGSRKVQLYNGRAMISVKLNRGRSVASVSSASIPASFCKIPEIDSDDTGSLPTVSLMSPVLSKKEVIRKMKKVGDWQLENMPVPGKHPRYYHNWDWTNASLFTGVMALYKTTGSKKYLRALEEFSESNQWSPGPRFRHADDVCIGQTYLELYEEDPAPYKIQKIRARVDSLMADPVPGREDYWWCDALFMSPPMLARLADATGDEIYLDYMNEMWWDATDFLYDPDEKLYYRDDRFRIKEDGSGRRENNGEKVFWSRGNGWVMGGMARLMDYMPAGYTDREKYVSLFKEMAEKVASIQGEDGLWKSSLLYPEGHDHGEISGTGFYCYALAWGINNGILDKEAYLPVVMRAWDGLNMAVHPSGKIGWVQQIGYAPDEIHEDMTETYGAGAYLLAGSEIYKLR